jgi:hypothetical protein
MLQRSLHCRAFFGIVNFTENKMDMVNHPSHYTQGKIECIDALEAATANLKGLDAVCTANAIKYLWRWQEKDGVRDLRKAIWYIERKIQQLENGVRESN